MGLYRILSFALSLFLICTCFAVVSISYDIFVKIATFFAVLKLAEWLAGYFKWTVFYTKIPPENKAVVITGCDSGFGHAAAIRLDKLGYRVFACCLMPSGEGALTLTQTCSSRLSVVPLDVTRDESVEAAKDFVTENLESNVLWAVVNNAGIPQAGEVEWTTIGDFQRVFDINCLGTVRVSKAFLPLLKKSKGRIINNTSAVGRYICPGYVGYCMSKSAAIAFTHGLRVEMMKWRIRAISIQPYFYRTSLTSVERTKELIDKTWSKADKQIREHYGEDYIEEFKRSSQSFLEQMCNPNMYEVVECFEHAVTAEEPLSTYFPSYLHHKLQIEILMALPSVVNECVQHFYMDCFKRKPIALMKTQNGKVMESKAE